MVSFLATSNVGAQTTIPSITLPANIPAGSKGYILVHSTSASAPVDMPGWTIKDGPAQAGANTNQSVLFQKVVGPADSGTTVTGSITTTGDPRWSAMCIVAVDAEEDSITYGADTSPGPDVDIPAFTPNTANVNAIVLGGSTVVSGLGHATWTPPAGYTEIIDTGSSYGTLNEVNVYAAKRLFVNSAGVTLAASTSTMTQDVRANVWVISFKAPAPAAQGVHVGGSAASSAATSVNGPLLTYPSGKQAGDLAILKAAWNPGTNATPTIPGYTMLGTVHNVASTMSVATYTKTLTSAETGVTPTFPVAARGGFTLDVWRNVTVGTVAYTDAATATSQTNAVPAVAVTAPACFTTSWFERSGVDSSVSVPSGTTLVDAIYLLGSGAVQAAVAFSATTESDGSVGAGSWARGNISPAASANTVVSTVSLLVGAGTGGATTGSSRLRWNGTAWIAQNSSRL